MASLKIAALQRNVLIALARFLMQDRPGGVMGPAIEMLVKVLRGRGAIAYKFENDKLEMVSETGLPRRAKAWLAHLRIEEEAWFIAQVVAVSQKVEIDETLAASRQGVSIRPALEEAGWQALAATPVRVGRRLYGVIVVASDNPYSFDKDTLMLLESVGGIVGLAMERDQAVKKAQQGGLPDHQTAQLVTQGLIAQSVARDLQDPVESLVSLTETQEHVIGHLRRQGAPADLVEHLDLAIQDAWESLRRVQTISARLLVLLQQSDPEPVNLTELVRVATESVITDFETRGILVESYGDDAERYVDGRIDEMQMMLVQLLVYAADKCALGPTEQPIIAIRVSSMEETHEVTIETTATAEKDGGQFNTLIGRSGAGHLGLELARETVKNHDGHVELGDSSLGGGSITIVLPASASEAPVFNKTESLPAMPAISDGRPVLVWIDGDADFVRVMCRQFESHDAMVAGTLVEGRAMLEQLQILPELILCDVSLPDGLGIRLHAEVPAELAERFVFMTGGVISEEVARYLKTSHRPTLIKPVRFEEVARLLSDEGGPPIARTLRQEEERAEEHHGIEDEESFDGYPDEIGSVMKETAPDTDRRGGMGKAGFSSTMPGYAATPSEPPPELRPANGQEEELTLDFDDGPELDLVTGGDMSSPLPRTGIDLSLDLGNDETDEIDDGWDI